jgi:excisionase family DNA binding protein
VSADRWVSVGEAAHWLGCHPRTLYDGVAHGSVPGRRVGRRVLIPRWWLDGDDLRPNGDGPAGKPGHLLDLDDADDEGRHERTPSR